MEFNMQMNTELLSNTSYFEVTDSLKIYVLLYGGMLLLDIKVTSVAFCFSAKPADKALLLTLL